MHFLPFVFLLFCFVLFPHKLQRWFSCRAKAPHPDIDWVSQGQSRCLLLFAVLLIPAHSGIRADTHKNVSWLELTSAMFLWKNLKSYFCWRTIYYLEKPDTPPSKILVRASDRLPRMVIWLKACFSPQSDRFPEKRPKGGEDKISYISCLLVA